MKKFDLSKIMRRAWELVKKAGLTISSGLKEAWKEARKMAEEIKDVVVEHFESYNPRRYSTPWVCKMTEAGGYNFAERIGGYTAGSGEAGDLVVYAPVVGQIYGWGQKDYRGNGTIKKYIKWDGTQFIECDKLGF